jgi:gliding motility-associated-like protein
MVNKWLATVLFLLMGLSSFAQLDNFTLDITVADETCDDNASLTFLVGGGTQGATFLYTLYKQPDLVNPVEVTTETAVTNLDSGTYLVVAEQSLGGESLSVEQEVVIQNAIEPLTYTISSFSQNCTTGGVVTVTTTSGIPAQYEIISGPETRPLQTSNVFQDLEEGTYNIRVFDICGQGVVTTYTLVLEPATPIVSAPEFEDVITTGCTSAIVTNTITYPEGVVISYPLTVTYTVYPPDGTEIVETLTYTEGAPNLLELEYELDLYPGEQFTYDISITNSCGNQYGNTGMVVNPLPEISHTLMSLPCGDYYFEIDVLNFSPPFTIDLQSDAEGFNPVNYNPAHPGPFSEGSLTYGGEVNPVPEGNYTATVTDACGRTATLEFAVIVQDPAISATGRNNGCFSDLGRIIIGIASREIVAAEIINGPPAYIAQNPQPFPHDVSSSINSAGRLVVNNLPVGDYVVRVTDDCGHVYEVPVNVPVFVERDFTGTTQADCTIGFGSLEVSSGNGALTAITLADAPDEYGTTPVDLSDAINTTTGDLYLDNLPEGTYVFEATDICGIERTVTVNVIGYQPDDTPFTFDPNCGSFDISMSDTDNISASPTYWLQELNTETGEWGHPATGVAYPEGTIPTEDNSFALQNGQTTFNLTFAGDFRIIKAFESFGNGSQAKNCIIELGAFNYLNNPRINSFFKLNCSGNPDDIYIDADGIAPLNYFLIDPATNQVILDNGTNNIFSGLAPGTYTFQVEDDCGNVSTKTQNINVLPDLVTANQPGNLFECVEPGEQLSFEFDLSQQNENILGDQPANSYTVTYHLTQADAENGTNAIAEQYTITQPLVTIYARLVHNRITVCNDVVSFTLSISENPELDIQQQYYLCEGSFVTVSAGNGYDTYLWSNGETSSSIMVTEPGEYSVTVTDNNCSASAQVTVSISEPATSVTVDTDDWTVNNNTIAVSASGTGQYEYSLNGITYQSESIFNGLVPGIYTVYVRDINGCGVIEQEVVLLNYPKFFTPNGDGINETWRIPFSWFEENLTVVIFDRFGKVISSFDSESPGWDGTYNGRRLPSTDYWFLVTRQDGRIHKGHFSMVR